MSYLLTNLIYFALLPVFYFIIINDILKYIYIYK